MIAFSIFWINVYRYWIFYLIGFVLAYCFLVFIWKKKYFHKFPKLQNLLENDLETLFIILILWVLIWWRLGHVLIYDFQYFIDNPLDIFKIWQWWMFWRAEWTVWTLASLWFLHIYDKIDSSLRINTNLLSIIFEWILLFITLIIIFIKQIKSDKRKIWKIWVIFLLRYSIIRFLFEYLRQDSQSEFIWPFTRSQRFFILFIVTWIIIAICLNHLPKENLENKKK